MTSPAHSAQATVPVDELRHVHLGMLDAVLHGGGVSSVARLAARELAGTVVVALPELDVAVCAPDADDRRIDAVRRHVADRGAPTPLELTAEAPVHRGDEHLGAVVLLGARRRAARDAQPVLRLAALAVLAAVALEDGTSPASAAALFTELRREPSPPAERIAARARELGSDVRYGGVALVARPDAGTVQRAVAAILQDAPHALVHAGGARIDALIPERPPSVPGSPASELARRTARRLARHGAVGVSAAEPGPAELARAVREAEVVLELSAAGAADLDELQTGTWRLLTRLAVMAPGEVEHVRATTVGPLLEPRARSRGALLDTLVTYLETGASMRATAAAGFAHRHTVAYRLERILELTGHDPRRSDGLEQLSLGLRARAVCDALRRAGEGRRGPPSAQHA